MKVKYFLSENPDGYITIIDEKSLQSENFLTHICGGVDTVSVIKTNHKYIVTFERGMLIYSNVSEDALE